LDFDSEHSSTFSVPEIVGIATAGAAALGGVIVALSRAQSHDSRMSAAAATTADGVSAGLQRGRDAARGAAEMFAERLPTLRETAVERLSQAAQRVQVESGRAAEAAGSGAGQARSTGSALLERVQETVGPALANAAETVGSAASGVVGNVSSVASGVVDSVSSAAASARDNVQPATSGVLDSVSAGAGRAVDTSTNLARETLAALFWLAAASAIVYLAILSPERREKVKSFVFGAIEETRLLVRDFQGYDEDI
jgi:hypothetical protein